jgi:hypothetical protein
MGDTAQVNKMDPCLVRLDEVCLLEILWGEVYSSSTVLEPEKHAKS